ncbi:MAG: MFS transporter [Anaerolineae bacterium]|nr:MFS transporter [Anaerolineae bacterium]
MVNLASSSIQRDLRRIRVYYLLLYCAGFVLPYLNLFYQRLGLSGTEIGTIGAVAALTTLLFAPIWTTLVEKIGRGRTLLQLGLILSALGYLWLGMQSQFLGITLARGALALVGAAIVPLSDALAVSISGSAGKGFGSVRAWSSVGWIFFGLSGGWMNQNLGAHAGFVATAVLTFVNVLVLFSITSDHFAIQAIPVASNSDSSMRRDNLIAKLRSNPDMLALALMMIVIGLGNSGILQFETNYLAELGASDLVIGIAAVMSAVVEIPFMLWADRLVAKRSARGVMMASLTVYVIIRLVVLAAPSPLMIIITRGLQGIAFSFYTIAIIHFIVRGAPTGQTRTTMALYNITLANVITILAAPVAGAAYDLFGARWLYLVAAIGYALGWLILRWVRSPQETFQAVQHR